jgi:hypothetical protein
VIYVGRNMWDRKYFKIGIVDVKVCMLVYRTCHYGHCRPPQPYMLGKYEGFLLIYESLPSSPFVRDTYNKSDGHIATW